MSEALSPDARHDVSELAKSLPAGVRLRHDAGRITFVIGSRIRDHVNQIHAAVLIAIVKCKEERGTLSHMSFSIERSPNAQTIPIPVSETFHRPQGITIQ